MEPRRRKPELLAPAGSPASLLAALEGGADAVYAGAPAFSARARAANFTLPELSAAASLCRREGRKLYAAVNTVVLDREVAALVDTFLALDEARVDGVILQDPGAALLARERFPSLPLHASTQMTIHDEAGVAEAAERGFRRVVLARELPLPRVEELARTSPVELEVFVHGALCHSVSGQCLLSSWMGGRSGNRGWCAQPCRRRFDLAGAPPFPFSTRDLSAPEAVAPLAAAGVASLKIEGRMKPPGWVSAVVSAYRLLLDAPPGGEGEALSRAREILASLPGRGRTGGLLLGAPPAAVAGLSDRPTFGELAGTVECAAGGTATFVTTLPLHAGDRLRWIPGGDREGRSFTLRPFLAGGRERLRCAAGTRVTAAVPFPVRPGDGIGRTGDEGAGRWSEEGARERLAACGADPLPVEVTARLDGDRVTLAARCGGEVAEAEGEGVAEGRGGARSDLASVLRERLDETGGTPFRLASCRLDPLRGLFLPPSRAKELRRRLYAALAAAVEARRGTERSERTASALDFAAPPPPAPSREGRPLLAARVEDGAEAARLAALYGADRFLLPLPEDEEGARMAADLIAGIADRVLFSLPFWCPSREAREREDRVVAALVALGLPRFEATNHGHLPRLRAAGAWILAGFRLHGSNRLSLRALASRGASAVLLPPEDDGENLDSLLALPPPPERWVYLYGRPPLLSSRLGPFPAAPAEAVAPGGRERFLLSREGEAAILRPAVAMGIGQHAGRLGGADAFVADLRHVPRADRPSLLSSLRAGEAVAGTVPFNFERRLP